MFPREGGGPGLKQRCRSWPLDPRLRGGTGRGAPPPPPPRRRPGSSWGTVLTKRSPRLLQPPQLDPGLRRGGVRYGARLVREMTATLVRFETRSVRPPPSCPGLHRAPGLQDDDRRCVVTAAGVDAVTLALIRSPAKAGAQDSSSAADHGLWTPAGAGERAGGHPLTIITTPAKAGVQLGDATNEAQHPVTATSPTGPRPSPGW